MKEIYYTYQDAGFSKLVQLDETKPFYFELSSEYQTSTTHTTIDKETLKNLCGKTKREALEKFIFNENNKINKAKELLKENY